MSNISVSSLAFVGPDFCDLAALPKDIGIEIFCEWATYDYWNIALPIVFKDRCGEFSIHAPFENIDISSPDIDEEAIFKCLTNPFDLYKKFNSKAYVLHTNEMYPNTITEEELVLRRALAEERVLRFNELAKKAGVTLLVENLGWGVPGKTLHTEETFLDLFARNKDLDCIIDVGHANVEHFDILNVQKTLGDRIKAYHIHNNDGLYDSHRRINDGTVDFKEFFKNSKKYTPNASYILEYAASRVNGINDVIEDINTIKEWLK